MFRPSESIASEIHSINDHNRELVRLNRYAEEEIATRRNLLNINANKLQRLFEAKATSERKEDWVTKPKVVWAKHPNPHHRSDIDYRVVGVSGKQIRVGEFECGTISLYKPDGHPVGRSTSSAIDLEKTFPKEDTNV